MLDNDLRYEKIWFNCIENKPDYKNRKIKDVYHFSYDEKNANELAELVRVGIKKGTSSLHLVYKLESEEDKIPELGDLSIITDYYGNPVAIIENTLVEMMPFNEVSPEFAEKEGEGDKSLDYWRRVHKDFFTDELKQYGIKFDERMLVVLEHFEVIYKNSDNL